MALSLEAADPKKNYCLEKESKVVLGHDHFVVQPMS